MTSNLAEQIERRRQVQALPAVLAFSLGAVASILLRDRPLEPDVVEFERLARQMSLDTIFGGVREPVWPIILLPVVRVFGDQDTLPIRLVSVLGFVFMILAFQRLTSTLFGRAAGTVSSCLLAVSPWMIYQATRGLREETSVALVLMLATSFVAPRITAARFVLLFAFAGLIGLLRWDAMAVLIPVLGVALLLRRPHPIAWVAAPVALFLVVSPLLFANYVEHGDPFYHSNIHARFFRNAEFHDKPGFVTTAEMQGNSFAGPAITWTQYVFGLHSPADLAVRAARAFTKIPINVIGLTLFFPANLVRLPSVFEALLGVVELPIVLVFWTLGVAGAALLLRTRAWPVPLLLVETILVYSPIQNLIDFRLTLLVSPLFAIGVMEAARPSRWRPALVAARRSYERERGVPAKPFDQRNAGAISVKLVGSDDDR